MVIGKEQIQAAVTYHLTPARMALIKTKQKTSVGKDAEKKEPFCFKDAQLELLPTASPVPFQSPCLKENVATGQHFSEDVAAMERTPQSSFRRALL